MTDRFALGHDDDGMPLWVSAQALSRHTAVCGTPENGETMLLVNLIRQTVSSGALSVVVIDLKDKQDGLDAFFKDTDS